MVSTFVRTLSPAPYPFAQGDLITRVLDCRPDGILTNADDRVRGRFVEEPRVNNDRLSHKPETSRQLHRQLLDHDLQ